MIDLTSFKARIAAAKLQLDRAYEPGSIVVTYSTPAAGSLVLSIAEAQSLVEELETLRVAPQQERTG